MITVLIVDDSPTAQANLEYILNSDPDLQVVGIANNGEEAIKFIKEKEKPDVITMDVVMPKMNGFETTKIIMESMPIPIVIISASTSKDEIDKSFKAFEAGALTLLAKPAKIESLGHPEIRKLISTVKIMSKVSLVRRWKADKYLENRSDAANSDSKRGKEFELVSIGVSTGGPPALQKLLKELPSDFSLPIVIVQHIALGFLKGLADWLNTECELKIKIAENGESLKPSTVYLAADYYQMGITSDKRIYFTEDEAEYGVKPSVSFMFTSIAKNIKGNSINILMTGMGKDGAAELKALKNQGTLTIIQDEESSIVFGMPGVAKSLDAQILEMNPTEIGKELAKMHNKKFNI